MNQGPRRASMRGMSTGEDRSAQIRELCTQRRDASFANPSAAFTPGVGLLENGLQFHELSYPEMRTGLTQLTRYLLLPQQSTFVQDDHIWCWAWCAELLDGFGSPYFDESSELELQHLFRTICRAVLLYSNQNSAGILAGLNRKWLHASGILRESGLVSTYLSFPLLEGLLKKECSSYVDMNGQVKQAFTVPQEKGSNRTYAMNSKACSSMADLLWLVHNNADEDLRGDLDEIGNHLRELEPSCRYGFSVLYRWRNASLHGQTLHTTIGGTVLNLAMLIALASFKDSYNDLRERGVSRLRAAQFHKRNGPDEDTAWISYYPPYWTAPLLAADA